MRQGRVCVCVRERALFYKSCIYLLQWISLISVSRGVDWNWSAKSDKIVGFFLWCVLLYLVCLVWCRSESKSVSGRRPQRKWGGRTSREPRFSEIKNEAKLNLYRDNIITFYIPFARVYECVHKVTILLDSHEQRSDLSLLFFPSFFSPFLKLLLVFINFVT